MVFAVFWEAREGEEEEEGEEEGYCDVFWGVRSDLGLPLRAVAVACQAKHQYMHD